MRTSDLHNAEAIEEGALIFGVIVRIPFISLSVAPFVCVTEGPVIFGASVIGR